MTAAVRVTGRPGPLSVREAPPVEAHRRRGTPRGRAGRPSRRDSAGLPTTSWCGRTGRVTTDPAPTMANSPMSLPHTIVTFAPIDAPWPTTVGVTAQSSAKARGTRSFGWEHHARTDEHVVSHGHPRVDRHVVLHLHPVADDRTGVDEHVLAQVGAGPDPGAGPDVGVVPDPGSGAQVGSVLDDCGGVDVRIGHGFGPCVGGGLCWRRSVLEEVCAGGVGGRSPEPGRACGRMLDIAA